MPFTVACLCTEGEKEQGAVRAVTKAVSRRSATTEARALSHAIPSGIYWWTDLQCAVH